MTIPLYGFISLSIIVVFSSILNDTEQNVVNTNAIQLGWDTDSLELVKIFNSTNGGNWSNKWDLEQPFHTWYGVDVNVEGCVIGIQLSNNNLTGTLPHLSLPALENFDANENNISGSVPDFDFPQVKQLRFHNNNLTGAMPDFSNMPLLESLNLGANNLNDAIPDFSNLQNLTHLHLGENLLSGEIPNFTGLPKLHLLNADSNQLSGSLSDFSSLQNLTHLSLKNNDLTGNIPNFSNMPFLNKLDLRNNHFNGNVPNFAGMPNLIQIGIAGNNLDSLPNDLPIVNAFFVKENRFTFDDLLPYKNVLDFPSQYVPQDSVSFKRTEFANIGGYHQIDLGLDNAVSNNIYNWFKDGQLYLGFQDQNKLVFNAVDVNDEGVYYCRINNAGLSHLTLVSHPITLVVTEPLVIDSLSVKNTECLAGNGSIQLFISGGLPPYLYHWNNGGHEETSDSLYIGLYSVTVSDATGQAVSDSAEIVVDSDLDVKNFLSSGDINCVQDKSTLEIAFPSSILDLTITWVNEDSGEIIGENVLFKEVEKEGLYSVFIHSPKNECDVDHSWEVEVDTISPNVSIVRKEYFTNDNTMLLTVDPTLSNLRFEWETPNGDLHTDKEIIADRSGLYRVTVINVINGCTFTTFKFIESLETPNAFTPNGDGINDILTFPILEDYFGEYPNNELIVFNRWNDIIYKAKPYLNDWNGKLKGKPLSEGTYYFILRLNNSNQQIIKGDLTILR